MTTTFELASTDTLHHVQSPADRAKCLRKIIREDGWVLRAHASDNWQVKFTKIVKGKPGSADVVITVRLPDRISLTGKWGPQQSFHDSSTVIVPRPDRAHVMYSAVQTAARLLLENDGRLMISGSSGSTSSSQHGLAFVALYGRLGNDQVMIGSQSVFVHGRLVCYGSVD